MTHSVEYFGAMVGHTKRMRSLHAQIVRASEIDLPVLLVGETGSGKELVAREIHQRSARGRKPFVALNTGSIPRELIASELFGHAKGAFTGASEAKPGRFLEAGDGTLFLDEIGTMEERVQISLLRVLENRTIRAVGSQNDVETHARIIAATNEDLGEMVTDGRFRDDLMYRLDVVRIDVPALREMRDEIPSLALHFVRQFAREYDRDVTGLSHATLDLLRGYAWPGNVRELRNVIAQACVAAGSGEIEPEHLSPRFRNRIEPQRDTPSGKSRPGLIAAASSSRIPEGRDGDWSHFQGVFMPYGSKLEEVDRVFISRTLEYCDNNKTQAAKMLGVSRKTLYDRLNRWKETA